MSITKSSYTKISALIMFILIQSLSDIYVMIAIIVLMEIVIDFILGGSKITTDGDCSHEIERCLLLGSYDQAKQHIKKQRHYFTSKDPSSQSYGLSSSHVRM